MLPDYPTIKSGTIEALLKIKRQYAEDQKFLDPEVCPYDEKTAAGLRDILAVKVVRDKEEVKAAGRGRPRKTDALAALKADRRSAAEEELKILRTEIEALRKIATGGDDDSFGGDPELRLQVLKAAVSLVEKLTTLEAKQFDARRQARFQSVILTILDDLVPEAQREEFMDRIQDYADTE